MSQDSPPTDELLKALGAVAREQEAELDEPWQSLVDGTLPAADLAELEARAERDAEVALKLELLRPLASDTQERIVDRLAQLATAAEDAGSRQPSPLSFVKILRVAAPLAAAAAFLLLLPRPAALAPLPNYELSTTGGQRDTRSAPVAQGAVMMGPNTQLTLLLRPATSVEGNVTVRLFVRDDNRLDPLAAQPAITPDGAVRIEGLRAAELGQAPGNLELVALVGRPRALENAARLAQSAPTAQPGMQSWVVPVSLTAE